MVPKLFPIFTKSFNPSRPDPGGKEKIKLNFYFHNFLWCLKKFYEGLKGLHKTFCGTTKSVKIKMQVIFISIELSETHGVGRVIISNG